MGGWEVRCGGGKIVVDVEVGAQRCGVCAPWVGGWATWGWKVEVSEELLDNSSFSIICSSSCLARSGEGCRLLARSSDKLEAGDLSGDFSALWSTSDLAGSCSNSSFLAGTGDSSLSGDNCRPA